MMFGVNRKNILYLLILIFTVIIYLAICRVIIPDSFSEIGGDSAQYLILAKTIFQDRTYRMVNYPGEPFSLHYPPIYPFFLSVMMYLFPGKYIALYFISALFSFGSLIILFFFTKQNLSPKLAILLALSLAVHPMYLHYSCQKMIAEPIALFFSLLSIVLFLKISGQRKTSIKEKLLFPLCLLLMLFSKYTCLGFICGFVIVLLFFSELKLKERVYYLLAICSLIVFTIFLEEKYSLKYVPSHIKGALLTDYFNHAKGYYLFSLKSLVERIFSGVIKYLETIYYLAFPFIERYIVRGKLFLNCILSGIVILGIVSFLKKKNARIIILSLCYFLFISVAAYQVEGERIRYLFLLLPFLLIFFIQGLMVFTNYISSRIGINYLLFILLSINLANFLRSLELSVWRYESKYKNVYNFYEVNYWLKRNIPANAVVISPKPSITYYISKRKAVPYPYIFDEEFFLNYIAAVKGYWLITVDFSPISKKFIDKLLNDNKGLIVKSYETEAASLYQFKDSSKENINKLQTMLKKVK